MKKRILIVDDDKLLNAINEKVLLTAGIVKELHFVPNGLQAMEYLTSRMEKGYPLPDVIILDLHMPVMNGFTFLDQFQKMDFPGKSNIQIVVFTASSNPKDKQKAFAMGVENYINKPYLLRGLTEVVSRTRITQVKIFANK
jgi:two-component system, CitB family, response regulator MalR